MNGATPKTRILSESEYLRALLKKLQEECDEFKADRSVEELADILEVIWALSEQLGMTREEVERTRLAKAEKRGAFNRRIFLESVDE